MQTVTQLAQRLGIAESTIRNYTAEFEEFFSGHAKPPAGNARQYTKADTAVLVTIVAMRKQAVPVSWDDIREALANGERYDFEPEGDGASEATNGDSIAVDAFNRALTSYEGRVTRLETRLENERQQLLEAIERATRAEVERDVYQEQLAEVKQALKTAVSRDQLEAAIASAKSQVEVYGRVTRLQWGIVIVLGVAIIITLIILFGLLRGG